MSGTPVSVPVTFALTVRGVLTVTFAEQAVAVILPKTVSLTIVVLITGLGPSKVRAAVPSVNAPREILSTATAPLMVALPVIVSCFIGAAIDASPTPPVTMLPELRIRVPVAAALVVVAPVKVWPAATLTVPSPVKVKAAMPPPLNSTVPGPASNVVAKTSPLKIISDEPKAPVILAKINGVGALTVPFTTEVPVVPRNWRVPTPPTTVVTTPAGFALVLMGCPVAIVTNELVVAPVVNKTPSDCPLFAPVVSENVPAVVIVCGVPAKLLSFQATRQVARIRYWDTLDMRFSLNKAFPALIAP
jgi:hypothetical protein